MVAEDDCAVGGVSGVTVPFTPPTGTGVTGSAIVGMAAEEVDGVAAVLSTVCGCGRVETAVKIDCHKIPSRSERTLGKICHKKHSIGTGDDGVVKVRGIGAWGLL